MPRSPNPAARATWLSRLHRFSSSGLTVSRFCADEQVSPASFYQWRRRLQSDGQPGSRSLTAFQPVEVVGTVTTRSEAPVLVRLCSGTTIAVHSTQPDVVRAVVGEVTRIAECIGVEPC